MEPINLSSDSDSEIEVVYTKIYEESTTSERNEDEVIDLLGKLVTAHVKFPSNFLEFVTMALELDPGLSYNTVKHTWNECVKSIYARKAVKQMVDIQPDESGPSCSKSVPTKSPNRLRLSGSSTEENGQNLMGAGGAPVATGSNSTFLCHPPRFHLPFPGQLLRLGPMDPSGPNAIATGSTLTGANSTSGNVNFVTPWANTVENVPTSSTCWPPRTYSSVSPQIQNLPGPSMTSMSVSSAISSVSLSQNGRKPVIIRYMEDEAAKKKATSPQKNEQGREVIIIDLEEQSETNEKPEKKRVPVVDLEEEDDSDDEDGEEDVLGDDEVDDGNDEEYDEDEKSEDEKLEDEKSEDEKSEDEKSEDEKSEEKHVPIIDLGGEDNEKIAETFETLCRWERMLQKKRKEVKRRERYTPMSTYDYFKFLRRTKKQARFEQIKFKEKMLKQLKLEIKALKKGKRSKKHR